MGNTNKSLYKIAGIALLLFMFVFMCYDAAKQSFWFDELDWTVAYVAKSNLFDMLRALSEKGYNLPLYYIVLFPVYKIVPYGELWLLLPNFFAIILGIYFLRKTGHIIGGEDLGFCSLCFAVFSYVLICDAGYELRPYAFLFLFSTLALYRFICLLQEGSRKNQILYTLSIVLLSYTHWFGCLIIVFYFLIDAARYICKKVSLTMIWPYICLGIFFFPWFVMILVNNQINMLDYWSTYPFLYDVILTIKYLLSYNSLCIYLLILGVLCFLLYALSKRTKETMYQGICVGSIIWVIGTIFIYSRFINPGGSLYVQRYFLVLLPHIFILMAIPLIELLHFEIKINERKLKIEINGFPLDKKIALLLVAVIVGSIGASNYLQVHRSAMSIYEPYRELSDIIVKEDAVYQDDGALVTSDGIAYLTYYFAKRGYPVPPNVYRGSDKLEHVVVKEGNFDPIPCETSELLKYNTLYVFEVHAFFEDHMWEFIDENYELRSRDDEISLYIYERKGAF